MKISASLLALVGAIAPPRISLNLEGMTSAYKLASPIERAHDLTYTQTDASAVMSRQDWTEKCAARRVCPTEDCSTGGWVATDHTNCPFPKAQGWDHQDQEVCVTTRIFRMDVDGTPEATAVHGTKSFDTSTDTCGNAAEATASAYSGFDFSKRSTYLFKYDASDSAGNHAEQVVFALILDDTQAPLFNPNCDAGKAFEAAITVEAVSDWRLCELNAHDNIDATPHATKYTVTWLQRGHGQFATANGGVLGAKNNYDGAQQCFRHADSHTGTGARTNTKSIEAGLQGVTYAEAKAYFESKGDQGGPDHVGKFLVEFVTEDMAGIYGHNAANNVRKIQQAILVRDTVTPTIYLEGSNPDYTECIRTSNTPHTYWEKYMFEESDCRDQLDTVALDRYLPVTTTIAAVTDPNIVGDCTTEKYPASDASETDINARNKPTLTWQAGEEELAAMTQAEQGAGKHGVKQSTLEYTCADYSGNTATQVTRIVHTVDTHAPTLELTKATPTSGHVHAVTDPVTNDDTRVVQYIVTDGSNDATHSVSNLDGVYGAYAQDSCDTTVNADTDGQNGYSMSWGPRAFNTKVLGDYVRTYTSSDTAGNIATKTRTYTVIDEDKPVIDVMECNENAHCKKSTTNADNCVCEATRDSEYTDTGATCHDFIDGELSHAVEVSGEVVNMRIPGEYKITYNCQDLSGNPAPEMERLVTIEDTTKPVLELLGARINYVEAGFPYVDGGATATDTLDGDITQYVWTDGNTVDTIYGANSCQQVADKMGTKFQNGEYMILTKASNGGVESHSDETQKVHCFQEGTKVISFKMLPAGPETCANLGMVQFGTVSNTVVDEINSIYSSAYSAGDLTNSLCKLAAKADTLQSIAGEPQQVTGKYVITYHVEDKKGNAAVSTKRTVVVKDTLPPVITLTLKNKLVHQSDGSQVGIGHKMRSGVEDAAFPTQFNPAGSSKTEYATKNGVPASYKNFGNPYLMAESSNVNGWVIGAVASAVAGVALLGFSAKKTATTVPV